MSAQKRMQWFAAITCAVLLSSCNTTSDIPQPKYQQCDGKSYYPKQKFFSDARVAEIINKQNECDSRIDQMNEANRLSDQKMREPAPVYEEKPDEETIKKLKKLFIDQNLADNDPMNYCNKPGFIYEMIRRINTSTKSDLMKIKVIDILHARTDRLDKANGIIVCRGIFVVNNGIQITPINGEFLTSKKPTGGLNYTWKIFR